MNKISNYEGSEISNTKTINLNYCEEVKLGYKQNNNYIFNSWDIIESINKTRKDDN